MSHRFAKLLPPLYLPLGLVFALPFFITSGMAAPLAYLSGVPALCLLLYELRSPHRLSLGAYWQRGFLFSMGYYLGVYSWFIYLYPLDFLKVTPLQAVGVVLFAWIGLSLVATLCFSFIIPNTAWVARCSLFASHPLLLPMVFPAVFTVFSLLISFTWAGVPWGMLALTQVAFPQLIATASLFGGYFVTFIVVATNAYVAYGLLILYQTGAWRRALPAMLLALSLFAGNLACGMLLYRTPHKSTGSITATVMQGNVSSRDKWAGELSLWEHYKAMAEEIAEQTVTDKTHVILWSETALPYTLSAADRSELSALAQATGAHHYVGAFLEKQEGKYNALFSIDAEGRFGVTAYRKRRPVPFGEFVPWEPIVRAVFPTMADLALVGNLEAGTSSAVFREDFGRVGALICFDSIYESLARDAVRDGAELLMISTNDSWFEGSPALHQHQGQAILRAVESGRYVLRAANTGISSVITDKGDVLCSLGQQQQGYLTQDVQLYQYRTLYSYIGNSFVYLLLALCLAAGMWGSIQRRLLIDSAAEEEAKERL